MKQIIDQTVLDYLFNLWDSVNGLNASVKDGHQGGFKGLQGDGVVRATLVQDQVQREQGTICWPEEVYTFYFTNTHSPHRPRKN